MIRKMIANWLLKGIRKDLESQAREVFKASLVLAFIDENSEDHKLRLIEYAGCSGFSATDMTRTAQITRRSIRDLVDKEVALQVGRLGGLRQGIPETVAAEVIRESTIDTIIAKINSKQLKGGIPT